MKVLIDTNVILDVLTRREPHYRQSSLFLRQCGNSVTGCIASSQTTDIFYILMRYGLDADSSRNAIKTLVNHVRLVDVTPDDVHNALMSNMSDFEDALLAYCAERQKAGFIVTRNINDFKHSPITATTPQELLTKLKPSL